MKVPQNPPKNAVKPLPPPAPPRIKRFNSEISMSEFLEIVILYNKLIKNSEYNKTKELTAFYHLLYNFIRTHAIQL
jgi:hypothetical protein